MNEWPALRIVHSLGGLRLISDFNKKVSITPLSIENKEAGFDIPNYHSLFPAISSINLPIYGVDFITHVDQIEGGDMPVWSPILYKPKKTFDYEKAIRLWSNISTGSHKVKNGHLWDLSSRISHQLRIVSWRLKEISNAYNNQLESAIKRGEFSDNSRFSDGYTWICFMTIQAFLIDSCILRDYLAEYAANYIYKDDIKQPNLNITTLSGLLKYVINKQEAKDDLSIELSTITKGNGWLKMLGDYRDLVMHSAPLSHAEKKLFAIQKILHINDGFIPYIICPIPDDPSKVYKFRSSVESYVDFDLLFNSFIDIFEGGYTTDGLTFCHQSISNIASLALHLGSTSPVKPEMVVLTDKDIKDFKILRF